jgi:3-phytase
LQAAAVVSTAAACALCKPAEAVIVQETWVSASYDRIDIDSLAFWPEKLWVLATAKESHEILVFEADTGLLISRHGGPGKEPGRFQRPNGLAVVGDLLLVVERDNKRVQILSLPDLASLGTFGEGVLRRPYGIAAAEDGGGTHDVYITDNYMTEDGGIPPDGELGERVKCFRLAGPKEKPRLEHRFSFGETQGPGTLHKVESIAVDPGLDRVLVADEDARFLHIAVYSLSGKFSGRVFGRGTFKVEPEGLALYRGPTGEFWMATDQDKSRTVFHLFSRSGLDHAMSFQGESTANTDGICVTERPLPLFPWGAAFAVHDDVAVSAFSWERLLREVPRRR